MASNQVTKKINLSITGPLVEKLTWEIVEGALGEHYPMSGVVPTSARVARREGNYQLAQEIERKNSSNYLIHRREMDAFWRALGTVVGRLPVPTEAVLQVLEGGESCILTLSHRGKGVSIHVPPPIDLERLMNPKVRAVRPLALPRQARRSSESDAF